MTTGPRAVESHRRYAPPMGPIANEWTLVVGEMPALTDVLAATLLVDVTWPPDIDVPLPSLVASSAALPDVAGRTQGNLQYLLCLKQETHQEMR